MVLVAQSERAAQSGEVGGMKSVQEPPLAYGVTGNTVDSESIVPGSNPGRPAMSNSLRGLDSDHRNC
jgi:hypothetical protein